MCRAHIILYRRPEFRIYGNAQYFQIYFHFFLPFVNRSTDQHLRVVSAFLCLNSAAVGYNTAGTHTFTRKYALRSYAIFLLDTHTRLLNVLSESLKHLATSLHTSPPVSSLHHLLPSLCRLQPCSKLFSPQTRRNPSDKTHPFSISFLRETLTSLVS